MTAVGFEPTRIAPPELESGALDRSAKLSDEPKGRQCFRREIPNFGTKIKFYCELPSTPVAQ